MRAGDIVIVENREFFPADLILLKSRLVVNIVHSCNVNYTYSSDPDGRCYIQTASLDGETNLKIRQAHSFTVDYKGRLSDLLVHTHTTLTLIFYCYLQGHVDCEPPNRRLYEFQGNLSIRDNGSFW